jgi:hypothetical protein
VRQAHQHGRHAARVGDLARAPAQHQRGAVHARPRRHHLDVVPADALRGAERLARGLLGGEARRERLVGVAAPERVFLLVGGEDAVEKTIAMARDRAAHPIHGTQIEPDPDHAHAAAPSAATAAAPMRST